ncbi:MAG: PilZ domain-containing protein [Phycisphaerales bacterium]
MHTGQSRRRHDRFVVPPMYTPISVRTLDEDVFRWEGHAYDISEGGLQFECDRAFSPGSQLALKIELPGVGLTAQQMRGASGLPVFVMGNVVWLEDEDEPGPARMALAITRFARAGDRERLMGRLDSGFFLRRVA